MCQMIIMMIFVSYQDDGSVIMNSSVQWSTVQSWAKFCLQWDSNPGPSDLKSEHLPLGQPTLLKVSKYLGWISGYFCGEIRPINRINIQCFQRTKDFHFFSTAVTLNIRSRSPKSNHFFVMSQLFIHENLVRIQPLFTRYCAHKESVTPRPMPTPTGSAPKSTSPSP